MQGPRKRTVLREGCSQLGSRKRYDEDSGLVFREFIVPVDPSPSNCRCRDGLVEHFRAKTLPCKKSARTLTKMAMNKCMCVIKGLDSDLLVHLPSHLLRSLWKKFRLSGRNSLQAWGYFTMTELGTGDFTHVCRCQCKSPAIPAILQASNSSSLSWMTNLTISNSALTTDDMRALVKMQNLRNVCFQATETAPGFFDDYSVRSWSECAVAGEAFTKLETMFLAHQRHLSKHVFQYLGGFPALHTFVAYECKLKPREKLCGKPWKWIAKDECVSTCVFSQQEPWLIFSISAPFVRLLNGCSSDTFGTEMTFTRGKYPPNTFTGAAQAYMSERRDLHLTDIDSLPVLDVILDQFHDGAEISWEKLLYFEKDVHSSAPATKEDEPLHKTSKKRSRYVGEDFARPTKRPRQTLAELLEAL